MESDRAVVNEPTDAASDFEALQTVIAALRRLGPESQRRVLDAAATFLGGGISGGHVDSSRATTMQTSGSRPPFSEDTSMSPKEFLAEKQPRTDVERIACLAYYLTNYRNQPSFKTLDLSKLNTEAAQPKFSNAANSVNNSVKRGYLAPATRGYRQLSAAGERFVLALPDREAARNAMASLRPRRRNRRQQRTAKTSKV